MRKLICLLCAAALILLACACGGNGGNRAKQNNTKTVADVLNEAQNSSRTQTSSKNDTSNVDTDIFDEKPDIDLTKMNATMVYSEVNNMMTDPDSYEGKIIEMKGSFNVFKTETQNYYACLIADATACCSQGIEFVLKNERKYPEEYPTIGQEITVIGEFETYFEGETKYCHLKDALIN